MNTAPVMPPPGQQVIHVTQDLDTDLELLFNSVMNPKPSSWRKKIMPESFFMEPDSGSHSRQSSTDSGGMPQVPRGLPPGLVQHVRSHSSPASLQFGSVGGPSPGAQQQQQQQHAHLRQQSYDVTDEMPLPPGWEMAITHTGQRYYLNHIEKITTWQDPRKTMTQPMTHINHLAPPSSTSIAQRSLAMSQPNLVLNHQHQPQMSSNTAMAQQQSHPTQNNQAAMLSLSNTMTSQQQQQQQQKLRLQRIQLERERIQMRQQELLRQEAALCRQLPMESENMAQVQTAVNTTVLAQDLRTISNNGSDPFLNSGPYHSREQSTDSGLGLGCYSIPTTPEDFLSNVDEMDTGESLVQPTLNLNPQSRFPDFLDSLPGTNVDLGTLESEDLIPILTDVESELSKTEPFLTWL